MDRSGRTNREILESVDALLRDADESDVRRARLLLPAARGARLARQYERAIGYIRAFPRHVRRFRFAIRSEEVRVEAARGNHFRARALVLAMIAGAAGPREKARALMLLQILYLNSGRPEASLRTAYRALGFLDIQLPELRSEAMAKTARDEWNAFRRTRGTREQEENSPPMKDPRGTDIMEIMMHMLPAAARVDPNLRMLLAARMCGMVRRLGITDAAAEAFAHLGAVRASVFNDYEAAHEDGRLALALAERARDPVVKKRVRYTFASAINHWRRPLRANLDLLKECAQESDEPFFAVLAARDLVRDMLICSESLEKVLHQCRRGLEKARAFPEMRRSRTAVAALLRGLMDESPEEAEPADSSDPVKGVFTPDHDLSEGVLLGIHELRHAYLTREYSRALSLARGTAHVDERAAGSTALAEYYLYYSLALAAFHDSETPEARPGLLNEFAETRKRLLDWAVQCPENYQHGYLLCEAEYARITGREREAAYIYDQAVRSARDSGFTNMEALASEMAARFYMSRSDVKNARTRMRDARYAYLQWGARTLVRALEREFAELLGTSSGDALDFNSVLEASRALSGEIRLERLPARLLFLAMEILGGRLGFLLLAEEGEEPMVVVRGTAEGGTVPLERPMALNHAAEVPASVIHHVLRTRGGIVLKDARADKRFNREARLTEGAARSVLCAPISFHGELSGVIYLEDNREGFAFDTRRLDVLEILCSQAAISLKNARLYSRTSELNRELREENAERAAAENRVRALNNRLEQRVRERTRELQAANDELRETLEVLGDTQRELIDSAKMAALGELTAGFAHEINTPLGVAVTAASFLEQFAGRGREGENRGELKPGKFEARIMESARLILSNVERAAELIGNFKETAVDRSRESTRLLRPAEYLEQTAATLAPVLKRGGHELEIRGDRTLELECPPGELAQIAVNLIMNSVNHAYDEGENGHFRFDVARRKDRVYLLYSDDGRGIPRELQSRIFEPFFTTSRGRGGTGLGLHIVYNIVTKKLGGRIRCESKPGETVFVIEWPIERHDSRNR